ncbi:RagB/SusD family nutrient uptake outer membrane protein [Sphingobacterium anhuiense]|uniref:RagB/SusD family nutrient uptake outer membrane protein n=1 Tax=Sphingobacterium anhuiense TaxID=493780 RepID=A0ABW5YQ58_9SPHI
MKNYIRILVYAILIITISCDDFLDSKPNQKMAVPKTLEHADLLLNDYSTLNSVYPTFGEIASDDYFISTANWSGLSDMDEKLTYNWSDPDIANSKQWQASYRAIYQVNQVLEVLKDIERNKQLSLYDRIKGGACFYRAFALHQLAVVFAPVYVPSNVNALGLPLRLSPDIDFKSVRSTLKETYDQIITDYQIAVRLLPEQEILLGRPAKISAYAGLARVYLDMSDYERAYAYADSALNMNNSIIDFNTINVGLSIPFKRFNSEVIFSASTPSAGPLGIAFCRVDTNLYQAYGAHDLRKTAFFRIGSGTPNYYSFKGSYDGSTSGIFVGLTVPELLLIRAEAAVRTNRAAQALADYNKLLKNRISNTFYTPSLENDPTKLLTLILEQRRLELIFRGRRWADLKRLNKEPRFAKQLVRVLDGKTYSLEPNSHKYAIKIPQIVIEQTGITQNIR